MLTSARAFRTRGRCRPRHRARLSSIDSPAVRLPARASRTSHGTISTRTTAHPLSPPSRRPQGAPLSRFGVTLPLPTISGRVKGPEALQPCSWPRRCRSAARASGIHARCHADGRSDLGMMDPCPLLCRRRRPDRAPSSSCATPSPTGPSPSRTACAR